MSSGKENSPPPNMIRVPSAHPLIKPKSGLAPLPPAPPSTAKPTPKVPEITPVVLEAALRAPSPSSFAPPPEGWNKNPFVPQKLLGSQSAPVLRRPSNVGKSPSQSVVPARSM